MGCLHTTPENNSSNCGSNTGGCNTSGSDGDERALYRGRAATYTGNSGAPHLHFIDTVL
jgi:hypothetical protein